MKRLLRRLFPTGTPPTVPLRGKVVFHCPACKQQVDDDARRCPACGRPLP